MVNEERVILMTKMASYEAGEGKRNMAIGQFFRSDYMAIQLLKALIGATLCYLMLFGLYIYYNLENLMEQMYEIDIWNFVSLVLKRYVIFAGVYLVIAYLVCSYKYSHAHRNLRRYYHNLKKLSSLLEEQ